MGQTEDRRGSDRLRYVVREYRLQRDSDANTRFCYLRTYQNLYKWSTFDGEAGMVATKLHSRTSSGTTCRRTSSACLRPLTANAPAARPQACTGRILERA